MAWCWPNPTTQFYGLAFMALSHLVKSSQKRDVCEAIKIIAIFAFSPAFSSKVFE
jgi:hypothetical protein